ncbi:hypothetical protein FCIRC_3830 [Fusarium circinatum]|uniref:Uncharacterized protein n=1 Tax=Fusarium circinatum TaxID=48490 RepID=A0A8H5UB85_FUSCI|nr:hypothetical protein FCIRC_3830 [Fusarium circinatum]
MNWRHRPPQNRNHFHEYRCIICQSVLDTHRSMRPMAQYIPTDMCYNCTFEISYSLATQDETSSQEFLQTRLPVAQAAEQIANEIAEASVEPTYIRPWAPTTIDIILELDDETYTEPSLYDETTEERDERFRNLGAVKDSQTHSLDSSPAPSPSSSGAYDSELGAPGLQAYVREYVLEVSEGEASEFKVSEGQASELDAPKGHAHLVDNAPAPHQGPNEQEEGLNTIRDP